MQKKGVTVPNSGHFIPEEQPDFLVKLFNNFFSDKPTEASKWGIHVATSEG